MSLFRATDLIGNTPLIDLSQFVNHSGVSLYGKLEGNNPGGSVKDRPALSMFVEAEKRGQISPKTQLIEATSGNTGIALAMIAVMKGYCIELVMPENASSERITTMRAYGAKVTLTSKELSMEGAIDYTRSKVKNEGYFSFDQFSNPDNYLAHYKTTGPEIWEQTQQKVTHFVSAMGTTGTIMGVSRFLKEQNPKIQIVGAQPQEGSSIPGIRRWSLEYLPKIFEEERVDRKIDVSEQDAIQKTRDLALKQGILAGMSSGGALYCALKVANEIDSGCIVSIICDRGDRYLSTSLFT